MGKKTTFYLALLALASCNSQKQAVYLTGGYTIESLCPDNGECSLVILKDKSMEVTANSQGKATYRLVDATGKTVLKYSYSKNSDQRLQDAGYIEEVIFETDGTPGSLNNSGRDMQKTKMLYKVMCFCPQAGYYKVEAGNMRYGDGSLEINLPEISNPQKTRQVAISFK